jgi:hypothetical protein
LGFCEAFFFASDGDDEGSSAVGLLGISDDEGPPVVVVDEAV